MRSRLFSVLALSICLTSAAFAFEVPRPSPEVTINMTDGSTVKLSQYKGKVVALMFFLTTCPHCQHTAEVLTGIQRDLGPKGFQVLAAAINPNPQINVPQFIKDFHTNFPVGYIDIAFTGPYMQLNPNVRPFVPFLSFIDRNGVIQAQYTGNDQFFAGDQDKTIRAEVEKLLAAGASRRHRRTARRPK